MVITSIAVAGTASAVSDKFDGFGNVGGIVGTSVSAAFLIVLGILNLYICYKLVQQMRKLIRSSPDEVSPLTISYFFYKNSIMYRTLEHLKT